MILFEVIKWAETSRLIKDNFNINYTKTNGKPDLFGKNGELWINVEADDLENIEILEILENKRKFEGDLYIITYESHKENIGSFKVNHSNLHKFINMYWEMFGGYFFNQDLLIFNFELKIVWVYHHSNFYEVLKF